MIPRRREEVYDCATWKPISSIDPTEKWGLDEGEEEYTIIWLFG